MMKILIIFFILLVSANKNNQQITASYNISPELFWLEEYTSDGSLDLDYLNAYSFIYYEPVSNQYYFAIIQPTNNIAYNTNNIQDEKKYLDYKMLSAKLSVTYIGSIDITNRVYIDTNGNQYLKSLELIDDTTYFDYADKKQILSKPVFPYARHYDGDAGDEYEAVFYSNDMEFRRSLDVPYTVTDVNYKKHLYTPSYPAGMLLRVGFL